MSQAIKFCPCVGHLQGLWYGWVNCTFPGHVVVGPAMLHRFSLKYTAATFELLRPTLVLVTHAIAFACRQLVKNCPSTQLMTHEVRELSQSLEWSGLSLTATLQRAHPPLVQRILPRSFNRRVSSGVHQERIFHNVQRHAALTFRHFAASWSCLEPVALFDQLSRAEDRRSHVRDSELCTHTLTFRSEPHVHSPRAMSFDLVSLCITEQPPLTDSQRSSWTRSSSGTSVHLHHYCQPEFRAFRPLGALTANIQNESFAPARRMTLIHCCNCWDCCSWRSAPLVLLLLLAQGFLVSTLATALTSTLSCPCCPFSSCPFTCPISIGADVSGVVCRPRSSQVLCASVHSRT